MDRISIRNLRLPQRRGFGPLVSPPIGRARAIRPSQRPSLRRRYKTDQYCKADGEDPKRHNSKYDRLEGREGTATVVAGQAADEVQRGCHPPHLPLSLNASGYFVGF